MTIYNLQLTFDLLSIYYVLIIVKDLIVMYI